MRKKIWKISLPFHYKSESEKKKKTDLLGPAFGRTDFSRIFIFGPPDFFADFLAGFFLLIFVGKSGQKNPPGKSPQKSSKIYTTKILRHISARLARARFIFVRRQIQGLREGNKRDENPLFGTFWGPVLSGFRWLKVA